MSLDGGLVEIGVREAESVKDRLIRPMQGHSSRHIPGKSIRVDRDSVLGVQVRRSFHNVVVVGIRKG